MLREKIPGLAFQFLLSAALLCLAGCSGLSSGGSSKSDPPSSGSPISVSINPPAATIQAFGQQQFQSTVQNSGNTSVTWAVDGVGGGNSAVGTVSNSGLYQAPGNAG